MLLWLTEGEDESLVTQATAWQAMVERDQALFLLASPQDNATGWGQGDLGYLNQLTRAAKKKWGIDGRRIVVGGQGKAGQTALALAIKRRDFFSGVIAVDAPLPRTLKLPKNSPANRLAFLMVETQDSNFAPLVRRDLKQLRKAGYAASWLQRPLSNEAAVDEETQDSIRRWIDGLDRF